jgi:tungstate transport system ATP-binding protein
MTASPVLSLAGVRARHPSGFALDIPTLDVLPGEVLVVIGPNGSGKSTLLRLLAFLAAPEAGEVRFHGRAVHAGRALDARRRVAMVFQQSLLADGTVDFNVGLGLAFRGVPPAERRRRATRWLERLGVAALAGRQARTLSGGEAQRVALARALVLEPEVLLLDEPFAALDEPTRAALVPELAAILRADRVTAVLVTHDRGEAQALGDRVAVLLAGRLLQVDEAATVFQAPVSEEVARFVGVETIVAGRVLGADGGVCLVEIPGARLEVAGAARPGDRIRVCIRPEDVTLAGPGDGGASSARNHLPGAVLRVTPATAYLRVLVDCGFPLVAAVTRRSAEELGLVPGARVTAIFKASAAHLLPASLDTPARQGL